MNEFVSRLLEYAEWADANEWECPLCLGDDLREAAQYLELWDEALKAKQQNKSDRKR